MSYSFTWTRGARRATLVSGGKPTCALPDGGCPDPTDAWLARVPPRRWSPELRLRFAVLLQALMEARPRYAARRIPALQGPAMAWITDDDVTWPYSFRNCCEALDLEPAAVRALLVRRASPALRAARRRRAA